MKKILLTGILMITGFISSGCATPVLKYKYEATPNITFKTIVTDPGFLASVKADAEIYRAREDCSDVIFEGRASLDIPEAQLAVPTNRLSYINFRVLKSQLNYNLTINNPTLIRLKKGYHYKMEASYSTDVVDFHLYRKKVGGKKYQEVPIVIWSPEKCRSM